MSEHLTNIVVVALIERGGKIFIAKRADTKATWPGRYELPGGHVDPGESLEDALRREVTEEIGAGIEIGQIVDAFTYESENTFKVEVCYLCRLKSGEEPKLNPEDHSESKWIGVNELNLFEDNDQEVDVTRKAFSILEGVK